MKLDVDKLTWGARVAAVRRSVEMVMTGAFLGALLFGMIFGPARSFAQLFWMAIVAGMVVGLLAWFVLLSDLYVDERRRAARHADVDELARNSRAGFTTGSPLHRGQVIVERTDPSKPASLQGENVTIRSALERRSRRRF